SPGSFAAEAGGFTPQARAARLAPSNIPGGKPAGWPLSDSKGGVRMRIVAAAAAAVGRVGAAEARTWRIEPGQGAEQELQTALIEARPGDTIRLGRGRFELTSGLSLDVDNVTVRGAGQDRSILSFANQRRGAEGLLVTSDGVTLRDFAVENARGDAIKARDCEDRKSTRLDSSHAKSSYAV